MKDRAPDRMTRLEEQQKELADKIRKERAKLKKEERQRDTQRKTILGGLVLDHYTENPAVKQWVDDLLQNKLVRDEQRALFGLPPRGAGSPANEETGGTGEGAEA